MQILERLLEFLIASLLAFGSYLLFYLHEQPLVYLAKPVLLHVSYYSIALVGFVFLFIFGLGSYIYLLTGGRADIQASRSVAGVVYLFAGFVLLLGVLRALVETGRAFFSETLWLSYALLWAMLSGWFWLQSVVERARLRLIYSAVYGLVIVLHFPIFLTAFSYHLEAPPETGLATDNMILVASSVCFFTLVFLRFYLAFKRKIYSAPS